MRIPPRLPSLALAALFSSAAIYAFRLAYANYLFHTGSPANIQRAAQLVPSNPSYALRTGNLKRALELNPYLSQAWIDLALAAEESNNFQQAERLYRKAAEVDKMFAPRWALANFYFRRSRPDLFWQWLRLAAERSYGDRTAIFRLAWRFTSDSSLILAKAIPHTPEFLTLYLHFLRTEQKWDPAVEAAAALAPIATPAAREHLLDLCEALLQSNHPAHALRVWNLWNPSRALDPPSGRSLANPDLSTAPIHKGFDWRFPWRGGVSHHWSAPAREIRITLDGREEERTDLLELITPVVPGVTYRLEFRYRLQRIPPASGIRWSIACLGHEQFQEIPITQPADQPIHTAAPVSVPARCEALRLTLRYQRQPGTVRPEGDFFLAAPFQLSRTR